MKTLWWITIVAFLLGIGVGNGIADLREPQSGDLPCFSPESAPSQLSAATSEPSEPAAQQAGSSQMHTAFPWALQYTSLVVQKLTAYDGPYLEDGSEENVMDVAALVVQNTGTIGIEYAQIVLVQNGQELFFDATYIPPRGTVLLLEENKTLYSDAPVTQCRCRTVIPGVFDWAQRTVRVKEEGMCSLEVTNLTDRELDCVRIFYKHHVGEDDLYVGGITYSAVISGLKPGETRVITPYRYASGYARVVAVTEE